MVCYYHFTVEPTDLYGVCLTTSPESQPRSYQRSTLLDFCEENLLPWFCAQRTGDAESISMPRFTDEILVHIIKVIFVFTKYGSVSVITVSYAILTIFGHAFTRSGFVGRIWGKSINLNIAHHRQYQSWMEAIDHLTSIGNPIVEIRRSYDRLTPTMGFPTQVRGHHYIGTRPRTLQPYSITTLA